MWQTSTGVSPYMYCQQPQSGSSSWNIVLVIVIILIIVIVAAALANSNNKQGAMSSFGGAARNGVKDNIKGMAMQPYYRAGARNLGAVTPPSTVTILPCASYLPGAYTVVPIYFNNAAPAYSNNQSLIYSSYSQAPISTIAPQADIFVYNAKINDASNIDGGAPITQLNYCTSAASLQSTSQSLLCQFSAPTPFPGYTNFATNPVTGSALLNPANIPQFGYEAFINSVGGVLVVPFNQSFNLTPGFSWIRVVYMPQQGGRGSSLLSSMSIQVNSPVGLSGFVNTNIGNLQGFEDSSYVQLNYSDVYQQWLSAGSPAGQWSLSVTFSANTTTFTNATLPFYYSASPNLPNVLPFISTLLFDGSQGQNANSCFAWLDEGSLYSA